MSVYNDMGKSILKLDTQHPVGERQLHLSSFRHVLESFSLNRNSPFNTVLCVTPQYDVDKKIGFS